MSIHRICIHIYVHIQTCMFVCVHMCIFTYVCTYVCMYDVCMYDVCMYACMYACMAGARRAGPTRTDGPQWPPKSWATGAGHPLSRVLSDPRWNTRAGWGGSINWSFFLWVLLGYRSSINWSKALASDASP